MLLWCLFRSHSKTKRNSSSLLESLSALHIPSFIEDLGIKHYFVPCSCVNCTDNYWAEICIWEHKASSHHHCIMEAICIHYIRLLWRAPENQRLINASDHNLLAAVQVAFDSVCRERESVRGRENDSIKPCSHVASQHELCGMNSTSPWLPRLDSVMSNNLTNFKGHIHEWHQDLVTWV